MIIMPKTTSLQLNFDDRLPPWLRHLQQEYEEKHGHQRG